VSASGPRITFLSDLLEWPAREGFQIHLMGLVRAAARVTTARALCWTAGPAAGAPAEIAPLDSRAAPRGKLARKLHYVSSGFDLIDRAAAPGSVAWVRYYLTALLALPGLRQRRRAGLRSVYDASSLLRYEIAGASSRLAGTVRAFAEERVWRHFDRVRTLNEPMRDYLVRNGVPAERVFVLPVGSEAQPRTWRLEGAPCRLLYVGSAAAWQGLPTLLGAMRRLAGRRPGVTLTLVGPSPADPALRDAPPNVQALGSLPHGEIARACLEHHLFVVPRPRTPLTETVTPMKLVEAMACGVPILASDLEAIRWTTGADGAVLVRECGDPEALATAIERALADPAALQATGARGLERSAAFTWEAISRGLARELFPGSIPRD
jgi:glycosyltransferase involved in cell wall biosynthesis